MLDAHILIIVFAAGLLIGFQVAKAAMIAQSEEMLLLAVLYARYPNLSKEAAVKQLKELRSLYK